MRKAIYSNIEVIASRMVWADDSVILEAFRGKCVIVQSCGTGCNQPANNLQQKNI